MALCALLAIVPSLVDGRMESTYSVTTVMRFARPIDVAAMNDPHQRARVLRRDARTITVEIVHYPFLTSPSPKADPAWRTHDASLREWLRPSLTCNWDSSMRRDLVAALMKDGIDVGRLSDLDVVKRVSRWLWRHTRSHDDVACWMVDLSHHPARIPKHLRKAFDAERTVRSWTDRDVFNHEVFGRAMFANRFHGACTSSATLQATVLRALGIPTRIIVCVPSCDSNDSAQVAMLKKAIHHHGVLKAVWIAARGRGFSDHMFNEVFVGGRWIRLNYDQLDQPPLDEHYLGLMTHVLTLHDVSEMDLSRTWGLRYANSQQGKKCSPPLSSVNPYMLVSASDHFGERSQVPNPPVEFELTAVTVSRVVNRVRLPADVTLKRGDLAITIKEWIAGDDFHQLRDFLRRVSRARLKLAAAGEPDVPLRLSGENFNSEGRLWVGFGVKCIGRRPVPGVSYSLVVDNVPGPYRFVVPEDLRFP